MEIAWLEDFVVLARLRHFSRAAEDRNVSQPAFSRRIQALEAWMGTRLINRRTTPVTLTAEGDRFRETAIGVLRDISGSGCVPPRFLEDACRCLDIRIDSGIGSLCA